MLLPAHDWLSTRLSHPLEGPAIFSIASLRTLARRRC